MLANALFAAAVFALALLFFLAHELRFLTPYRFLLLHQYGVSILLYFALFFGNVTATVFTLGRGFFLKDTGRKLAHFDRELNPGGTPMPPHLHREELN